MRGKLKHFSYWLAGTCAAAFLLVAGCGADTGGANDDAVSTMPTAGTSLPGTGSGTATPSASTPPTTLTKPIMPPEAGNTTLKGHLTEPVEAGCVVLSTDNGTYVLLGAPAKISKLESGTELVVRGSVAKSTMTICQQGTPFKVDTATPG